MKRIKSIPLNELVSAAITSKSAAEACRKLGLNDRSGATSRLKECLLKNNIDISHWTSQLWAKGKTCLDDSRIRSKKSNSDIFTENSNASSSYVRKLILRKKLLEYKCQACKMDPFWNGKELKFQLDHINGVRTDNRIENLRWLCANCHSQTDNFCGKNKRCDHVPDYIILEALENHDSVHQALMSIGLGNGRNYKRAKTLLTKIQT